MRGVTFFFLISVFFTNFPTASASAPDPTQELGPTISNRHYETAEPPQVAEILYATYRGSPRIGVRYDDEAPGMAIAPGVAAGLVFDPTTLEFIYSSEHGPVVCGKFVKSFGSFFNQLLEKNDWRETDFRPSGKCTAVVIANYDDYASPPSNWIIVRLAVSRPGT